MPEPEVMGWRHAVKSHSLCSGGQTETALIPAGFWCSSSMRKIRLRFTYHVGQYQCSYLFSVINMQRSTSVLVNYLQQSYDGAICLLFLKLSFPSLLFTL